jgi:molecular chaperone GrpE
MGDWLANQADNRKGSRYRLETWENTDMRPTLQSRLREQFDRLRGNGTATEFEEPFMSQTRPETSEELLETIQNTDPVSHPAEDLTTGIEGTERTAGIGSAEEAVPQELERLRTERDTLLDRLARLQAEFENARRRADRERSEFREYATGTAAEPFLSVLDNFHLALNANGTAEQLRGGIELIVKQMEEALRTLNVMPVETVGTQFDPRFQEALGSVENEALPDGQVFEEIRRGYRIRERLLRPALVRVVSNPQQKQA